MYAIIKSGGHQYRVAVGDRVIVDRLAAAAGSEIELGKVLFHKDKDSGTWGTPHLDNVAVRGKIISNGRHPKVVVFKYKRRKNYKRTQGWKQPCSEVEITAISNSSA